MKIPSGALCYQRQRTHTGGYVAFQPRGNPSCPVRGNPVLDWQSKDVTYSARIIVGFNVGKKRVWYMPDLIRLVKYARKIQTKGIADSTFVYQKGIYTYMEKGRPAKETVEPGGQVILFNVQPCEKPFTEFRQDVMSLAAWLCEKMRQEKVIVDFYKDGLQMESTHVPYRVKKVGTGEKEISSKIR